jgi:hypothetical protein
MTRRKNDAYYTPTNAIEHLLSNYEIMGRIYEPCAGDGAISKVLKSNGFDIRTNDLYVDEHDYKQDARDFIPSSLHPGLDIQWTITNPPFNQFMPILENCYKLSNFGVVMLLRLSALEPCYDRWEFMNKHLTGLICIPRISFTGDGKTDSVATAWFIFDKYAHDKTLIVTR